MAYQYLVEARVCDPKGNPTDKTHRIVFESGEEMLEEEVREWYEKWFAEPRSFYPFRRKIESVRQVKPDEIETGMCYGI